MAQSVSQRGRASRASARRPGGGRRRPSISVSKRVDREALDGGIGVRDRRRRRRARRATPGIGGGDSGGGRLPADRAHELVGRALDDLAGDEGADGDDRCRCVRRSASLSPGTARIGPIEMTGFEGPMTIASAAGDRVADLGGRAASRDSGELDLLDLRARRGRWIRNSWKSRQPAGVRTRVRTGSSHIGRTVASTPSAARDVGRDGGQPLAALEPAAALEAGREVAVGEPEPVRRAELDLRRSNTVNASSRIPQPRLLVDLIGQPVGAEVGIGGDVDAEGLDVVARCWRSRSGRTPTIAWIPAASLAPPVPPASSDDVHAQGSVSGRPTSLSPAWAL